MTQISVDFFDHVRGKQPEFVSAGRCIFGSGEPCREQKGTFYGSFAFVHYEMRGVNAKAVRERLKLIDKEDRLPNRPVFEKTVPIKQGIWNDLQLFGYQASTERTKETAWQLFRQELFFDHEIKPFLILHWKHSLEEITLIDVIQVAQNVDPVQEPYH